MFTLSPKFSLIFAPQTEAYSEPCQTPKMERFERIANDLRSLTIFAKRSILDI